MTDTATILQLLEDIAHLLHNHGVPYWDEIISVEATDIQRALEAGDRRQLLAIMRDICSFYGSIGSFNDLFITHRARYRISPEAPSQTNS
jgi:hypothetical protein